MSVSPRRTRAPLRVEVLRGPIVESVHDVVAVVLDEHGSLHKSWGNPEYAVYPRSSIKPLQIFPFLASRAFEKFNSRLEYLALGCSSHRGEDIHVAVLHEWAKEIGAKEDDLACGPVRGSRFRHNCSGKHMAALSVCKVKGLPFKGYHEYDHPIQQEIRKFLSALSGTAQDRLPHGIDGCGFPTIATPIQKLAAAFLPFVSSKGVEIPGYFIDNINSALRKHPDLYSGTDELERLIIQKTEGKVLIKGGAEGNLIAWLPEQKLTFAMKSMDGALRPCWVGFFSICHELKILTTAQFNALMEHQSIAQINSRNEVVGSYRVNSAAAAKE